ncbi:MAG: energy transducer TonB [Calditrichaeota bacterium]|nr:MAG: energy transducer TonB [Calditrichota bacterium]
MDTFQKKLQAQGAARSGGGYRIVSFPKEFEKNFFEGMDKRFFLILFSSLLLSFTTIAILANMEFSSEELQSAIKEKYIQKFYATQFEEPQPEEVQVEDNALAAEEGVKEEAPKEDTRAKQDQGKREEASGQSAQERREQARRAAARRGAQRSRVQQQVASTGVLGELSASGGGGTGDAVYDVLGEGGDAGLGNLEDAIGNADGLVTASSSNRRSSLGERKGGGGRKGRAGIDDLISGSGVGTGSGVNIKRDAGFSIKGVGGGVSGRGSKATNRSQDAIGQVVAQHTQGIQQCYKKEARINPNLKGSVTVQFTIAPNGRVTRVRIVNSSLKNRNVENCISRRIKSWRFKKINPKDGNVNARYKWIFSS